MAIRQICNNCDRKFGTCGVGSEDLIFVGRMVIECRHFIDKETPIYVKPKKDKCSKCIKAEKCEKRLFNALSKNEVIVTCLSYKRK